MNLDTLLDRDLSGTLIVCPNDLKNVILERLSEEKKIIDVKFTDRNEYRKRWFFDYDTEALRYVTDRCHLSIDNARELLQNLYYVEPDKVYGNEKLDGLVRLRKELDERGLLIYDPLFHRQVKERKVIVAGYGSPDPFERKIYEGEIIGFEERERRYEISCFEDVETEVQYLYDRIFDLIQKENVDINDISILNASSEYEPYFKRFNSYYPFTVSYVDEDTLGSTVLGKRFIDMLEGCSKEEIYSFLQEEDGIVAEKLMRILNSYPEYEITQVRDLLIHDVEHTPIGRPVMKNVVQCRKMYTRFSSAEHVFLIGFNDTVPAMKQDTEYLSDDLKRVLGMDVTEEENRRIRNDTKAYLSQIDHLYLSYSERSPFKTYNPNELFSEDSVTRVYPKIDHSHSHAVNSLRYAYMQDRFARYSIQDEQIPLMYKTYGDNDYSVYDNRFKGLRPDQIDEIRSVTLSYSSMDEFYLCSFRYYLNHILTLSDYEDTFYTLTGTLCHEVLKDLYQQEDFDFECSWAKHCDQIATNGQEAFFLEKLKEELREDVEVLKRQEEDSLLHDHMCERKFETEVDERIRFKGLIDKVVYRRFAEETVVSVIDYKTGNTQIHEKWMPYGLSLQLPAYMYLINHDERFGKDVKYSGFYLQHLFNTDLKYHEDKDQDEVRQDNLKLAGFTTADVGRASLFDLSLEEGNSRNIAGLKLKKDGTFYSSSRTLTDEKIEELIALVETKIREAGEKILSGEFPIDPKMINGKNESCKYCPYASVCFHRADDLKWIDTDRKEEDDG